MTVRPFSIDIPRTEIDDLARRLAATRWPNAIVDDWSDGTDVAYLRSLVEYWRDGYDWRAEEARLNGFPQFLVRVADRDVHFVHVRGKGASPLPLLISHGWPGSFIEMLDLIPLLTDPERFGGDPNDSFDVVVPSLPGYGFSQKPLHTGTAPKQIAATFAELMSILGYPRFGAQGGDWGSAVSTHLGIDHSDRMIGVHLNYVMQAFLPSRRSLGNDASPAESAYFDSLDHWQAAEGGYAHLQGTKPQTLAYALTDSPAGLAGYLVEKFRTWTDCDGDIERALPRDTLLTNIAIYWFTQTIGSSMHLYWERGRAPSRPPEPKPPVPFGIAMFPKELSTPPRELIERSFRVERYTKLDRGGHFAALEQPRILACEIVEFFRPLRG